MIELVVWRLCSEPFHLEVSAASDQVIDELTRLGDFTCQQASEDGLLGLRFAVFPPGGQPRQMVR